MSPVWFCRASRSIAGERMRTPSSSPLAAEHLGEAVEVAAGRGAADVRGLDFRVLEQRVVAGQVAAEVLDRHRAAHVGLDVPRREVGAQAHAGVVHAERREQVLVQQRLVIAALGVGADQRGAHQHVVDQRRVVAAACPAAPRRGRSRSRLRTAPAAGRGTCPASASTRRASRRCGSAGGRTSRPRAACR